MDLTTLLLWIGAVLIAAIGAWLVRLRLAWMKERRRAETVHRDLRQTSRGERFSPNLLDGLPAPARRYLEAAIAPGTPLAGSFSLSFEGSLQTGPRREHFSLAGDRIRVTASKGFIWEETLGIGTLPRHGVLWYANDEGRISWSLLDKFRDISDKSAHGPDINRSMKGRYLSHLVWLPSALLPGPDVRWEPVDDQRARAIVRIDGEEIPMTFTISESGEVEEVVFPRWGGKNPDGSFGSFDYGLTLSEPSDYDGYTIPTKVTANWCHNDPDRPPPLTHHYRVKEIQFA